MCSCTLPLTKKGVTGHRLATAQVSSQIVFFLFVFVTNMRTCYINLKHDILFFDSISTHGVRVFYYIKEYCPIKDSSNMTISDWIEIALDIKNNYDSYDGFVVIHGTDTMAYSVSALSFMLENLGKSVVFTGSQVCVQYSNLLTCLWETAHLPLS